MEMGYSDFIVTVSFIVIVSMFFAPILFIAYLYIKNKSQTQHSLLRGRYWFLGILRYLIENVGPEFRFYITDEDLDGKPISREKFTTIVKASKYLKTVISFGSKRNFSEPGIYIKNSLFPKLATEQKLDTTLKFETKRYIIDKESIFFRHEHIAPFKIRRWLLEEEDAIIVGEDKASPWRVLGQVGMSAMSFGALGKNSIRALSHGIGMIGGSWMNTGEGGLSGYHLEGQPDTVVQIGPALFGVRDKDGGLSVSRLQEIAALENVKAFEIKLGQGAKVRGGRLDGAKVSPEIAKIRNVEPWKLLQSPNRFTFINNESDLFDFVEKIQDLTGKPVGVKIVVGGQGSLDLFVKEFVKRGRGPDFITIDGSEGGTGSTYKEMADSLGLPIFPALIHVVDTLNRANIRSKVKIIAAGKLHLPDEIAIALALGADLVANARGLMISIGCIMAHKCHTNNCPVGVATNDPKLQRSLYVDEKKYRVVNYITTLRAGLFNLAAACGLDTPTKFSREHLSISDEKYNISAIK
ncbi:MAG: glutamate synthase-related protein [Nitrospinota bacterium]